MGKEDVQAAKSGGNDLGDLFEDLEFGTSLSGISVVVSIVEFALLGLGSESVRGVLELLLVLSESSLLVHEGGLDFSELGSISSKLGLSAVSPSGKPEKQ